MKVSILSMQRVLNYGSVLQAYGLKKIIESLDKEIKVDFIDVKCKNEKNIAKSKKCFSKLKSIDKYFFKKMKFKKNEININSKIKEFQKNELGMSEEYRYNTNSDYTVIGSDEVFNCDPKCAWGVSGQLFGEIDGCNNVISYAASSGYTKFEDLNSKEKEILKNAAQKLKKISVRDENTHIFIEKLIGKNSNYNLDPVLMYDFQDEIKRTEKESNFNEDYMIVYSYRNRIKSQEEIKEIKKFAKKNKLKIYCVQGLLPWCDEFKEWSPFEVLAGFKNAKYVVTDTFHGCVMASKFNKKFAVLIRNSNKNKITDLLKRLGLLSHKVENIKDLEKILKNEVEYDNFNNIIRNEKVNTYNYLKNTLN